MSAYIEPIEVAVFMFPFLALLLSLPIFVKQYRQYGRFILSRGIIIYTFIFYLLCVYFLIILPLPTRESVAQMTGPKYHLVLGTSLNDFLSETVFRWNDPSTFIPAMKQSVFLEPAFNLLLFFPLGIYLRYYFKFDWKKTLISAFLGSLFLELTQLTGLYFIYPRPYRLFDVNDLFHNTLGGMIGYWSAPLLTLFLPTREELDELSYEKGSEVTLVRRLVAFLIDWLIIGLVTFAMNVITRLVSIPYEINSETFVGYFTQVVGYWVILNYFMKGQTFGKRAVKIQIVQTGKKNVSLVALGIRYGLFYLLPNIFGRGMGQLATGLNSSNHHIQQMALLLFFLISGYFLVFFLSLLTTIILRKKVFFYEKASHTHVESRLYVKIS